MPASYCLDLFNVGVRIGTETDKVPNRICLPYINVGIHIGDPTPFVIPDDYLMNPKGGFVLINPKTGQPLINANRH